MREARPAEQKQPKCSSTLLCGAVLFSTSCWQTLYDQSHPTMPHCLSSCSWASILALHIGGQHALGAFVALA